MLPEDAARTVRAVIALPSLMMACQSCSMDIHRSRSRGSGFEIARVGSPMGSRGLNLEAKSGHSSPSQAR